MGIRLTHPTNRMNFSVVKMDECEIWFSYETPVAIRVYGAGTVVHVNDWGATTGKHLNYIDGGGKEAKTARLEGEAFRKVLDQYVGN